jgi:DNA polymerase
MRTLPAVLAQQLGVYALNDVELTAKLYDKLLPGMPDDELALIDLTMRWCCRPVLCIDLPRIVRAYKEAARARRKKIRASGTSLEVLSSQQRFLDHLINLDIEVPYKTNSKGKQIPALAKNDLGFQQMMTDYPEHRALFEGRMAAKSTLEVTRIKRIYKIGAQGGTLPMPLNYYGAHTGRWSGADGLNPQNFTRGSELRKSVIAPPGWVILVADYKQIELRLNVWFCSELMWLDVLRKGMDIYRVAAAQHFEIPYEEVDDAQRFFGKTLELGLGYNMGWKKFRTQCALKGINLTEEQAYKAVNLYRNSHPSIRGMWTNLSGKLIGMYQSQFAETHRPVQFIHEGVLLPNGMRLDYAGLTPTEDGDWYYGLGNKRTKIYGGKMLENIMQALARVILGEHLLEIQRAGIISVSSTHDEPIMVVREKDAEEAAKAVEQIMVCAPSWAPKLPIEVEVSWAKEYSK